MSYGVVPLCCFHFHLFWGHTTAIAQGFQNIGSIVQSKHLSTEASTPRFLPLHAYYHKGWTGGNEDFKIVRCLLAPHLLIAAGAWIWDLLDLGRKRSHFLLSPQFRALPLLTFSQSEETKCNFPNLPNVMEVVRVKHESTGLVV